MRPILVPQWRVESPLVALFHSVFGIPRYAMVAEAVSRRSTMGSAAPLIQLVWLSEGVEDKLLLSGTSQGKFSVAYACNQVQ